MDPLAQYLDEKSGGGGADPLADYLDEKEGGPESFLRPDKFKPSPIHRKFHNTGPIAQVQRGIEQQRTDMPTTTDMVIRDAPGAFLSMADRASLGALGEGLRGATRINEATGTHGPTLASNSLDAIERYRREAPTLSNYTDMPGYLTGAPEAIAGTVERVLPEVVNPIARAARASLGAGLTSAGVAGGESAVRGDEPAEIAREAGRGYVGGTMVGAPMSAASVMLGRLGDTVLGTRGGRARTFLEGRGVDVGPTTPGRGGPMDTMVTQGTSDKDIGHQAEVSAKRGLGMLREETRGVKGAIGLHKNAISQTPEAAQQHDVTDIVTKMNDALSDIDLSDYAEGQITKALGKIHKAQGVGFNPETDNYYLSETDLNKLRRRLDKVAKTGESTDAALQPLKDAANAVRELVSQGPYADVNKQFANEFERYQRARGQLGIQPKTKTPGETKGAVSTVKNLIGRQGQNTITAGGQQQAYEDFKRENPSVGAEFERPEILRRRADIGFHLLPQRHGGLIDRTGSAISGAAALEGLMHLASHGHIEPGKIAAAAALGLLGQNVNAINARLLYGPAQNAQLAAQLLLGDIPGMAAAGREVIQEKR